MVGAPTSLAPSNQETGAGGSASGASNMSGLPREVLKWLQSLDLSLPLKNVRRDFSNGYLIAEIFSWYYDKEIQMHSFSNGTSLQTKLGNWKLLEKLFSKEKMNIPQEFMEGTIHCKPGAAIALLERVYVLLTNRELHYLPAKNRPNDFTDKDYQSQLPLYARSTTSQSIKTNIAATELKTKQDRTMSCNKAQAIIEHFNEQKKQQKQDFPERFEYSQSRKLHPMKSSFTEHSGEEPIAEVTVKQPLK